MWETLINAIDFSKLSEIAVIAIVVIIVIGYIAYIILRKKKANVNVDIGEGADLQGGEIGVIKQSKENSQNTNIDIKIGSNVKTNNCTIGAVNDNK